MVATPSPTRAPRAARHLFAAAVVGLPLVALACTKPVQVKTYDDPLGGATADDAGRRSGGGSGSATGDVPASALAELKANFEKVYFEYDSFDLTPATRAVLDRNAEILTRYPSLHVTLEGHCDDRGSTEYNLALGERRSTSVHEYLIRLGVPEGQLDRVSFGEERPEALDDGESAWARNRRVEFVAHVRDRS